MLIVRTEMLQMKVRINLIDWLHLTLINRREGESGVKGRLVRNPPGKNAHLPHRPFLHIVKYPPGELWQHGKEWWTDQDSERIEEKSAMNWFQWKIMRSGFNWNIQVVLTEEGSGATIMRWIAKSSSPSSSSMMRWIAKTIGRHLSFGVLLPHYRDTSAAAGESYLPCSL